jgi:predicted secreted protein
MRPRRILLVLAGLVVVACMAFFLQDTIQRIVVTPLAYLWWLLKLAFTAISQLIWWILLLAVLMVIVLTSLVSWISIGKKPESPAKAALGSMEILSGWITKAGKGNYYRWMIANRLAKLWGEISGHMENRSRLAHSVGPNSIDRQPPEAVQRYLKAGLSESFVDYPLPPFPFMRKQVTPFDLDVNEVVEFLESQMEERGGRKHA